MHPSEPQLAIADVIAEALADVDALVNINSRTAADGLFTDWEGSSADTERAGASVRALIADAIAEVLTGAAAPIKISTGQSEY